MHYRNRFSYIKQHLYGVPFWLEVTNQWKVQMCLMCDHTCCMLMYFSADQQIYLHTPKLIAYGQKWTYAYYSSRTFTCQRAFLSPNTSFKHYTELMYTAQIRIFVYNLLSTTEHLKEKTGGIFIAYQRFCCFHGWCIVSRTHVPSLLLWIQYRCN